MPFKPTLKPKNYVALTKTSSDVTAKHKCVSDCPFFDKCKQQASENLVGITGQSGLFLNAGSKIEANLIAIPSFATTRTIS